MFFYKMNDVGVTQKIIAHLAGVNNASVSRWFQKNSIFPKKKEKENAKNLKYSIPSVRSFFKDMLVSKMKKSDLAKMIMFYNFKGGTGKTSVCFQVSSHLALMGFNILVVDCDPQGHLSTSFGFDNNHDHPTLSDIIMGTVSVEGAIRNVYDGLDCIPSNLSLTKLEVILNDLPKREERLKILFEPFKKKYDFIIFDSNPTISLLNRNLLVASDTISIVCETQPYSLNGLKLLMEDMTKFFKNMEIEMPNILLIPNKYEDRSSNAAEAMTVLRQYYAQHMLVDFAIRRSEDVNTSAKLSLPLAFFVRTNSIALEDFSDLIQSLLLMEDPSLKFGKES
ncbi:MAG: hypothetical protein HEEMFOPI_01415 [Holosporales bacterium]